MHVGDAIRQYVFIMSPFVLSKNYSYFYCELQQFKFNSIEDRLSYAHVTQADFIALARA